MYHRKILYIAILLFGIPFFASATPGNNAPEDQPRSLTKDQYAEFDSAIAPYVELAQKSYPQAKARFLKGLPNGQAFFLTTRIHDNTGHWEQAFILVSDIKGGEVIGRIASHLLIVKGYQARQQYSFPESDILDWLISKPDGSEEGNYVGKYLDSVQ